MNYSTTEGYQGSCVPAPAVSTFRGNSPDKLRHPRSDAYSAQQVLLNKQQIWCGGAYLDCYRFGCFRKWSLDETFARIVWTCCDHFKSSQTWTPSSFNMATLLVN